jgi:hypothetical protein
MVRLPLPLDALRKLLQKTALLFILPLTVVGAIWIVNVQSLSTAALVIALPLLLVLIRLV